MRRKRATPVRHLRRDGKHYARKIQHGEPCAYCGEPIEQVDIEVNMYVYSEWTDKFYHGKECHRPLSIEPDRDDPPSAIGEQA